MSRLAARAAPAADQRPGRTCPLSYRYSPRVFDRPPELSAEALYVVGGLYGNVEALEAVKSLLAREPGSRAIFNGDFHWFDVEPSEFASVTRAVLAHSALRGNVETEIAREDEGAGCGCAYPADVSDAEVSCSNEILVRLRGTARQHGALRERLAALPMHLTATVGTARIGVVHGDAASLAGWGFARDRLDDPGHRRWIDAAFADAKVDVFASTHTCLPALRRFSAGVVANNGAAGMPNFAGTRFGIVTRIALEPFTGPERIEGLEIAGVHVETLRLEYDHERWLGRFLRNWPDGTPAHRSYHRRIVDGPRLAGPA